MAKTCGVERSHAVAYGVLIEHEAEQADHEPVPTVALGDVESSSRPVDLGEGVSPANGQTVRGPPHRDVVLNQVGLLVWRGRRLLTDRDLELGRAGRHTGRAETAPQLLIQRRTLEVEADIGELEV